MTEAAWGDEDPDVCGTAATEGDDGVVDVNVVVARPSLVLAVA